MSAGVFEQQLVEAFPELGYGIPEGVFYDGIAPFSFILWRRRLGSDLVRIPDFGN